MMCTLPWKNNQPCDNQNSLQLSLRRIKMAPLHNKEFCGPETILQTSKGSGNKSEMRVDMSIRILLFRQRFRDKIHREDRMLET